MGERLLLALAICLLGVSVYAIYRGLHMAGITRLITIRSDGSVGPVQPTLLYFRSDSCGPCLAQARYLEQVKAEFGSEVAVEKIDADFHPDRAAHYGIFTLPTTILIDASGTVRHINYGLTDARKLAKQLRSVVAPQAEGPDVAQSSGVTERV